jgi:tetratricopeptide (TPR) repeat protein
MGCKEMREKRAFTPKAEKAFLDSLRLNPDSKCALRVLLAEWTLKRKPKVLVEKLLPIAKLHPESVNLNLVVANALRIIKKDEEASRLLEKSYSAVIEGPRSKTTPPGLKSKLLFNLGDLLAKMKQWEKGEEIFETAFKTPRLSRNLMARLAAARFFSECADIGPDGFFAGMDKRRRKRALLRNLSVLEELCATEEVPASTLLAICKIYNRHSMPERADDLVLTQLLNNPNSSSSMLVLAKVFDNNKDYANEVRTWRAIIHSKRFSDIKKAWAKAHPGKSSSTELYFQLGLAAVKARDWSEALSAFDWRLMNAPDDMATIFQIGLVQMRMGKFRKALFHFKKIDSLPFALYFSALCHRSLNEYEAAFDAISDAERLARKIKFNSILNEAFYTDYAFIADKVGEFKITRTILETLLKNNPDDPILNNFLGYAFAEKGVELEKAEKLVAKALAAEPDNEAYLDSMAWILFKQNRCREAAYYIDKAIESSKGAPDAVIADHAGDIYLALGKVAEALKYWRLAQTIFSRELDYDNVAAKIKAVAGVHSKSSKNNLNL